MLMTLLRKKQSKVRRLLAWSSLLLILYFTPCLGQSTAWPNWQAATADGREFQSDSLEGKVVVLAMWASWCPSCRKQLPILNNLQNYYGSEELQVVSFSFDHSNDIHQRFVAENGIEFPSIYARSGQGLKIVRSLQQSAGGLDAVPTVLIYDRKGQLAHRVVGFFNREQLDDMIKPLVKD